MAPYKINFLTISRLPIYAGIQRFIPSSSVRGKRFLLHSGWTTPSSSLRRVGSFFVNSSDELSLPPRCMLSHRHPGESRGPEPWFLFVIPVGPLLLRHSGVCRSPGFGFFTTVTPAGFKPSPGNVEPGVGVQCFGFFILVPPRRPGFSASAFRRLLSLFVIPAQAGIQCFCLLFLNPWILAFAGMTIHNMGDCRVVSCIDRHHGFA